MLKFDKGELDSKYGNNLRMINEYQFKNNYYLTSEITYNDFSDSIIDWFLSKDKNKFTKRKERLAKLSKQIDEFRAEEDGFSIGELMYPKWTYDEKEAVLKEYHKLKLWIQKKEKVI